MMFVFIKNVLTNFGLNSVSNFEKKSDLLQHEIIWFKFSWGRTLIPSGSAKRRRKPLVKQKAMTQSGSGFFFRGWFFSGLHMWIFNGKSNQLLRWSSILQHLLHAQAQGSLCERVWWPLVIIHKKEGVGIQRYDWSTEAASGRWPPLTGTHSLDANCIWAVTFWLPAPGQSRQQ